MVSLLKKNLWVLMLAILAILIWWATIFSNQVEAVAPKYDVKTVSPITKKDKEYIVTTDKVNISRSNTLRENIKNMFYPKTTDRDENSVIYVVIRDMTLWIMIIFFVIAGASLLLNKKPEESKKHLTSLLYIMLWWVLVYGANWLFGEVFNFWSTGDTFTRGEDDGLQGFKESRIWRVFFLVLSAIKAAAFFLAIIMTVVTGCKVMAAGEWDKWKKLVKWLINVVIALLVIKWVDFIYYVAADSENFVKNASDFIINVAKVFGYLYGIVTVIMVIVAWYLFITDGWSWSNFKKATNIIINILLSALVLFGFLLIVYQIFAEFQTWGDAVSEPSAALINLTKFYV